MNKLDRDTTSAIIDGLLKFLATGGVITTSLIAPGMAQIFDKPITKMLKDMDKRSRDREIRRIAAYMKSRGLIVYNTKDYEHGIKLTKEGCERLKNKEKDVKAIPRPAKWDKKWRLIFFDIPVERNGARQTLTRSLRRLGFQQLQLSIWVHPFPCRPEIETIATNLGIRRFLTYIEISSIDSEEKLRTRFKHTLNS